MKAPSARAYVALVALTGFMLTLIGACQQISGGSATDFNGFSQVQQAALKHNLTKLKELLSNGADPNAKDSGGVSPLHRAARDGDTAVATLLLRYRANPNITTETGWTPLELAARSGNARMVRLLIQYGADVRMKTPGGLTPLLLACRANSEAAAENLISDWALKTASGGKSNINDKDSKGWTALDYALANKNWGLARTLVLKGADVNLPDAHGNAPLFAAVRSGDILLVSLFLDHGAKPNVRNDQGLTPLRVALARKNIPVAQMLYQYGGR